MSIRPSLSFGSSNWVFRIGEALAIRLPRSDDYVKDLLNEVRWMPYLGPHLTAPIPEVVASGPPSKALPRPWAILSWLPGTLPLALGAAQQALLAESLGGFLQSLHAVSTTDIPAGPERWGYRCGEPVTDLIDGWAAHAADQLADLFDPTKVREAWRRLRDVPAATDAPCWVHTDLSEENLLTHHDGTLAGVIDFGGIGVGDRSVDMLYAWSLFDGPARELFRVASGADAGTWSRARAWAFVGPGLLTIANYRHTMPAWVARLTAMVERAAAEVDIRLR
ncbi:phosphotransferase [Nakamurella sp. YIM 132087]|uniref:Phosphotransferase n=2 Tax=Nakamurella alba TaxID=2665158 RepID=A0A7K1FHK0_9ACTN|nr:phosphotransferase [Nakamurella alba]